MGVYCGPSGKRGGQIATDLVRVMTGRFTCVDRQSTYGLAKRMEGSVGMRPINAQPIVDYTKTRSCLEACSENPTPARWFARYTDTFYLGHNPLMAMARLWDQQTSHVRGKFSIIKEILFEPSATELHVLGRWPQDSMWAFIFAQLLQGCKSWEKSSS